MSLSACVYVTGCGNTFFAQTFAESFWRFTNLTHSGNRIARSPTYVLDVGVGTSLNRFESWMTEQVRSGREWFYRTVRDTTGKGSINSLWNSTVRMADDEGYDIAVICNDDIYLSPGWLEALLRVFELNPHVALCGIPAHGQLHDQLNVKERWFMDESLFYGTDFESLTQAEKGFKPQYESWTSGPLWACRVKPWLEHAVIPADKWAWGYAEPSMALQLYNAGWYTVSVYDPLILHYGGGAYWTVGVNSEARRIHNGTIRATGGDARNFAGVYGTSELSDLNKQWQAEFDKRTDVPELRY